MLIVLPQLRRIPCLEKYDDLEGCRELTWPSLLYPKAEKFKDAVKKVVAKSQWANETNKLTTAWLNYIGFSNYYHRDNTTASSKRDPGAKLSYAEDYLAFNYQVRLMGGSSTAF